MDLLEFLLDFDRWAAEQFFEASASLIDVIVVREFDVGHRTLRETFGYMVFNAPFWTAFLVGEPATGGYSADTKADDRSLSALAVHHARSHAAFAAAGRRGRDEGRVGQTFTDHFVVRKSFGGTILMVVGHNVERRTKALRIIQRLGVEDLPEVDAGAWDYLPKQFVEATEQ